MILATSLFHNCWLALLALDRSPFYLSHSGDSGEIAIPAKRTAMGVRVRRKIYRH